jgi:hypothetical protein
VIADLTPEQFNQALDRISDISKFEQKGTIPPPRYPMTPDRMMRNMAVARKAGLNPPVKR